MAQQFARSHILLTGVTGFVGQAVLERLLFHFPGCRVTVVIRAQAGNTAEQRLSEVLGRPVFDVARDARGDEALRDEASRRVTVLAGDLADLPELPADIDIVMHSASNVSFDPPIDEAFPSNVAGPVSLYRRLADGGLDPHVVHVSTSYAVGARVGGGLRDSLDHTVDYAEELGHALQARARADELREVPKSWSCCCAERGARTAGGTAGGRRKMLSGNALPGFRIGYETRGAAGLARWDGGTPTR